MSIFNSWDYYTGRSKDWDITKTGSIASTDLNRSSSSPVIFVCIWGQNKIFFYSFTFFTIYSTYANRILIIVQIPSVTKSNGRACCTSAVRILRKWLKFSSRIANNSFEKSKETKWKTREQTQSPFSVLGATGALLRPVQVWWVKGQRSQQMRAVSV